MTPVTTSRGGDPLRRQEQTAQQCLPPASQNVNPLHGLQVSGPPGKTQRTQALEGTVLYSHGEATAESASVVGIGAPGPHKEPPPSLPGGDTVLGLARCCATHTLKQNKGAYAESRAGKDIPT